MNIGLARLKKEYQLFQRDPPKGIWAEPDPKNWFAWHFVLFSLPADTPYAEGFYHGELIFPLAYPNAPPDIMMHTPSGRFEIETKICTSFSSFHPETWSPASWNVQTILQGIVSFFLTEEGGTGTTRASTSRRKRLAECSLSYNAKNKMFVDLFGEKLQLLGKDLSALPPPPAEPQASNLPILLVAVIVAAALLLKHLLG